ncbi:MAG: creatininase family protein [Brevinema sp.]
MNKKYSLAWKTRDEASKFLKINPIIILPLGAVEQHGYHLPLGTDYMIAEHLSYQIAEQIEALVAPPMPFGYSWVWRDILGTLSIEQDHMESVLKDLAHSSYRWGAKLFVVINGHEANNNTLKYISRELGDESKHKFLYLFYPKLKQVYNQYCSSETWNGIFHADEFETSLMLTIDPSAVQMEKAQKEYPKTPDLYGYTNLSIGDISLSGVYGDPTKATADKGEAMLKIFVEESCHLIQMLLRE